VTRRCIAVLGGSFDPVHNGHVALGAYFASLLQADELRVIPAGNPWQKHGLHAAPADRVAMVGAAFQGLPVPVVIDRQEILRESATYTIDTLRALRRELGPEPSIAFLIGADQLLHLDTWQEWRAMFDHAHICAASRPGFDIGDAQVSPAVRAVFAERAGSVAEIRAQAHGRSYLATDLAVDISATEIRAQLQRNERPGKLVPAGVLDYIEQHNLYKRS
jgi:nicotinate-nucleotide adenylyltransferase